MRFKRMADAGYVPVLGGQMTTSYYEDGNLINSFTNSVGPPDVAWMEQTAASGVSSFYSGLNYDEASSREVRLATGGKAVRQSQALFDLSAGYTQLDNVDWGLMFWWEGSNEAGDFLQPDNPPKAVSATDIKLDTLGNLGSDGHLLAVAANGSEQTITPQAAGNFTGDLPRAQKLELALRAVNFGGIGILKDDGSGGYTAPQWENDAQGKVLFHNPVLLVAGNRVQTDVEFAVSGGGAFPLVIKGEVSGGHTSFTLWATNTPTGNDWAVTAVADAALPTNTVDYFNPMIIKWSFGDTNNQNFVYAGSSTNQVYIALQTPTTANLYYTVVHLACSKTGATNANTAAANTWSLFSGPANVKTWDGQKLYYYQPGISYHGAEITTSGLLSVRNGQCTAWRALLHDTFNVNGIAVTDIQAQAIDSNLWFLVRDWTFGNDPYYASDEPEFKWCLEIGKNTAWEVSMLPVPFQAGKGPNDYGDLTSLTTLWGQNSQPPSEKFFHQHQILLFNGIYFDPSYGSYYTNAVDFETQAVAGYAIKDISFVLYDFYKVRKPSGTNAIVFIPLN